MRDYLAAIGKRGGLARRRELTRSHAKQMVAIREVKRGRSKPALAGRPTLRLDGDTLGREAGHADRGSRESVVSSRPQTAKTYMTDLIYRKPLTIYAVESEVTVIDSRYDF